MANYDNYQLDEMENDAVNKSKNLKRGLAVGAGVLGAGGAAAFGAERIMNAGSDDPAELTSDNILAGANTAVEEAAENAHDEVHNNHEHVDNVHVHHVVINEPIVEPYTEPEMNVEVTETAVLLDENGNPISAYDAGKINGKDFVVIDQDMNGKGDILAIDENNNGVFEENEITRLDNSTYQIGQGHDFKVFAQNENGEMVLIHEGPNEAFVAENHNEGISDIHNDFTEGKAGETYHGDLAENNPDYNNHGGEQYSAGIEHPQVAEHVENDFNEDIYGLPNTQPEAYNSEYYTSDSYDSLENNHLTAEASHTESSHTDYGYTEDTHTDFGYSEPAADTFSADHSADVYDDPVA